MNYFAHALHYLDRPHFLAGTGVPDWLSVADRPVRMRVRNVEGFCDGAKTSMAEVAGGGLQHLRDDIQFHQTRAFAETSLELTVRARDVLEPDSGLRPAFLGHLLTEILLDAALIDDDPGRLTEYYRVLDRVEPEEIQSAVNRMAPRPTQRLAGFIHVFRRERILWNYLDDGELLMRLNQVMRRLKLAALSKRLANMLPDARRLVRERKDALLAGIPS
jgi:hypothetical protein